LGNGLREAEGGEGSEAGEVWHVTCVPIEIIIALGKSERGDGCEGIYNFINQHVDAWVEVAPTLAPHKFVHDALVHPTSPLFTDQVEFRLEEGHRG
jgi:hypothetical protein